MDFTLEVRDGDLIAATGRVIVTLRAMTGEDDGWWQVILNPNEGGRTPMAKSFSSVGEAFRAFGEAAQVFSFYGDRLRRIREDLALPVTECDLDTTCRIERFFRGYCHCPA
jgi:hypothetical protein